MRILVVGAGAVGGYFGGRLLEAGRDVTFLVRAKRAETLKRAGLSIRSPVGDFLSPSPPTTTAESLRDPFDLIILSCKAYDLESALDSIAPAVGAETAILPLLNGMQHLEAIDRRFGAGHSLGGTCIISATLDSGGAIVHLNALHALAFGERDGARSPRVEAIANAFAGARFEARLSEAIIQEMWEKWMFIAAAAGVTCLMRASVGDVVAAGGATLAETLIGECAAIAERAGFKPSAETLNRARLFLTAPGSAMTASMLRDIENKARIEADHIVGDLLRRDDRPHGSPLLAIVDAHLRAYEARRIRESA